jgi:predicted aspartyl protease
MMGIALRALLGSLLLSSMASTGSPEERPDARVPEPVRSGADGKAVALPFQLIDGYLIVVEGRIGAHRHLKFALDTGATFSVLRRNLADLGFERRTLMVANLDHVLGQEAAEVPDLQLGPIKIPVLPMMLDSLDYLRTSGASVDAVIGLDVLKRTSLTIDFARHEILFGQARRLREAVPLGSSDTYLSVEIRIEGQPFKLILDSGVPSILLYRDRLGDRTPHFLSVRTVAAASLGGSTVLTLVKLPPVKLGTRNLDARAAVAERSPAGSLVGVDGYLSLAALHAALCSIDLEQKILSWQ